MNKLISVILPVYKNDKPEWLRDAVNSILEQSYKYFHIFIGVDGPVEKDLQLVLQTFKKNENITIKRFNENRGLACVLNDLLDICFNDGYNFVARMDADDISLPSRFEKQLSFLVLHPEIDVVGGAINEIDDYGLNRGKVIVYPAGPKDCLKFFSKRNPHAHPAVMFRKSYFDKVGCKYRPEYRQNQDTMLWYDGIMKGVQMANIPDVVLNFRMTQALFKKRRNGWEFAKKQLKDRLMINRKLHYGLFADLYACAMFTLLVSPPIIKMIAYRLFR